MSPAEILKEVIIKPIELECLDRVFNYLISKGNSQVTYRHQESARTRKEDWANGRCKSTAVFGTQT